MPVSPFRRAEEEEPEGNKPPESVLKGLRGKKHRKAKQRIRERYAKAREDAQLAGVIPTVPEGAVHAEVVDPASQNAPPLIGLVTQALKEGWKVPEEKKQELVAELISIVLNPDMPSRSKITAFNALRQADRLQWEQDNPIEAGKVKGGNGNTSINVSIQSNQIAAAALREMFEIEQGAGQTALPSPIEPSTSGSGRFDGEVEVGSASTSD